MNVDPADDMSLFEERLDPGLPNTILEIESHSDPKKFGLRINISSTRSS